MFNGLDAGYDQAGLGPACSATLQETSHLIQMLFTRHAGCVATSGSSARFVSALRTGA